MNPSISPLKVLLGTIGYLLVTFPLAFVWHLVLVKETYDRLGSYSRKEPIIAFGFGAILLQGILLSLIYPQLRQCGDFGAIPMVERMRCS